MRRRNLRNQVGTVRSDQSQLRPALFPTGAIDEVPVEEYYKRKAHFPERHVPLAAVQRVRQSGIPSRTGSCVDGRDRLRVRPTRPEGLETGAILVGKSTVFAYTAGIIGPQRLHSATQFALFAKAHWLPPGYSFYLLDCVPDRLNSIRALQRQ
eukprot:IDg19247t1